MELCQLIPVEWFPDSSRSLSRVQRGGMEASGLSTSAKVWGSYVGKNHNLWKRKKLLTRLVLHCGGDQHTITQIRAQDCDHHCVGSIVPISGDDLYWNRCVRIVRCTLANSPRKSTEQHKCWEISNVGEVLRSIS